MRADHDRLRARIVLAGLFVLLIAALVVPITSSPAASPAAGSGTAATDVTGDAAMFSAVVDRLRQGESYYPSMGRELRARAFPTASIFNWRAPALYVGLAVAPAWAHLAVILGLAIVLLAALMVYLAKHESPDGTVIGLAMAAAAVASPLDVQARWTTEAWSGLLIGLSVAAYLWRAPVLAATVAMAALFLRELAAPYCLVCVVIAFQRGRTRELGVWAFGLAAFAVYYGWHVAQVLGEIRPGDPSHDGSWIQFGGLGFWLAALRTNRLLFATPQLVLATAAVLLVAALSARNLPLHVRWTVIVYGAFFAVAGQPFNDYWGFVPSFVCALALAWGPAGLRHLISRATAKDSQARAV